MFSKKRLLVLLSSASLFFSFTGLSENIEKDNLVFHFNFKEPSSNEYKDQTGKFKCIVKDNITRVENGGLRCTFISDISVPFDNSSYNITDELTLSVWILQDDPGRFQNILFKGNRTVTPEQIQFSFSLNKGFPELKFKDEFGIWQGLMINGDTYADSSIKIPKLKRLWTHLAVTFNKGLIKFYINGKLEGENKVTANQTVANKMVSNEFPLFIGAGYWGGIKKKGQHFGGLLNDLYMYSKTLSGEDINQLYLKDKNNYPQQSIVLKNIQVPELDPEFKNKLKLTSLYEKNIPIDTLKNKKTTSHVRTFQGVPSLFINDSPVFPMMMMPQPWATEKDAFKSCRDFAAAGVNLYSDIIYTNVENRHWWLDEGKYDFDKVDTRIKATIDANPNALIMLRIKLDPPKWWCDKNPDDISVYYNGKEYISMKKHYSLASKKWEASYERMLRDFIRHVESSDYAGHITGYHTAGGRASEWYWYGEDLGPLDYCNAAQKRFKEWVMEKYNNDLPALQKAWNDAAITFEKIKVPEPALRMQKNLAVFNNPAKTKQVIDYMRFMNDVVTENIIKSSRICKEETNNNKITCAFYGYSLLYEGDYGTITSLKNNGYSDIKKVLASPYVDFIASPTDYKRRDGGEPGVFNSGYNGSYRLHNKLYWDEADIRTHLYNRQEYGRTENIAETISVLQRAFGYSLTKGTALWWFLLAGNASFHQEEIMTSIAEIQKAGTENINIDKTPLAQVALIADEESMYFSSSTENTGLIKKLVWNTYHDASRIGAPYDVYLLSDIAEKAFPDYKLYIFLNCFSVPQELKEKIKEKIRKNNAVSVWCYAPGYINDNGFDDGSNMSDLTGIKIKPETGKKKVTLEVVEKTNTIIKKYAENIQTAKFPSMEIEPVFYVEDSDVEVLGKSNGKASLVVKKFKDWQSIYSLMPLNKELMQGLCDYAGVHLYSRSFDVISANKSFIMVHTSSAGKKEIKLPGKYDVEELLYHKKIGKNISEFTEELPEAVTRIYKLSKPE